MRRILYTVADGPIWFFAFVWAVAGMTAPAAADIIHGQFAATVSSGEATVFNPDFSFKSQEIIPAGTPLTGTFSIDTSLLPIGVTTTSGDPATNGVVQTTLNQAGGGEWLTIDATLGLASPVAMKFARDPQLAKPADASSSPGNPVFTQEVAFARAFNPQHCCDQFFLLLGNQDSWITPAFDSGASYLTTFALNIIDFLPPTFLSGVSGFPRSADFDISSVDPVTGFDGANGSGNFDFDADAATFAGGQETFFVGERFSGLFDVQTLSFDTVEVPEPPPPSILMVLALLFAPLLTSARRRGREKRRSSRSIMHELGLRAL